jgi:hypothetical protein
MAQLIHVGTNRLKKKTYKSFVEEVSLKFEEVYGDTFEDYFQHIPLEEMSLKIQTEIKEALKEDVKEYAFNMLTTEENKGNPLFKLSGLGSVKLIRQSPMNKAFSYPTWEFEAKNLNNLSSAITIIWHLNEMNTKGELEFNFQEIMIQPSNKEVVIFPSYFTHAHKFHPGDNPKLFLITTFYIGG